MLLFFLHLLRAFKLEKMAFPSETKASDIKASQTKTQKMPSYTTTESSLSSNHFLSKYINFIHCGDIFSWRALSDFTP